MQDWRECSSAAFRPILQRCTCDVSVEHTDDRLQRVAPLRDAYKSTKEVVMNMPQPHTKNRPARWPSPVSGTIGSRDGWKDLIRMTQEPAMQQAIDKAKNAVHLRIRRLSQQSSTASLPASPSSLVRKSSLQKAA